MKLPALIEKELAPLEGRWEIKNGGKHWKLFVDAKLVGIFPFGSTMSGSNGKDRSVLNMRSNIRRHLAGAPC